MSSFDSSRTLLALELLRKIRDKIAAGAEFSNTDSGRASNEFYTRTRDRAKQFSERTNSSEGELSFLQGIEARLRGKRK